MKKKNIEKTEEEIQQEESIREVDELFEDGLAIAGEEERLNPEDEKDPEENEFGVQSDSISVEPEAKTNEAGHERFNVTKWTEVDIKDIVIPEKLLRSISDKEIDDLATSIDHDGILQPILIMPDGTLVAGYGRYRAYKKLRYKKIPVTVIAIPDGDRYRKSLIENLQRRQMSAAEEGNAFWELLKDKKRYPSQQALAEDFGIREARVTDSLHAAGKGTTYATVAEKKKAAVEAEPKLKWCKIDWQNLPENVTALVSKDEVSITFKFKVDDKHAKAFSITREITKTAEALSDIKFMTEMNILRKNA